VVVDLLPEQLERQLQVAVVVVELLVVLVLAGRAVLVS
jgi:hypothetical protein